MGCWARVMVRSTLQGQEEVCRCLRTTVAHIASYNPEDEPCLLSDMVLKTVIGTCMIDRLL